MKEYSLFRFKKSYENRTDCISIAFAECLYSTLFFCSLHCWFSIEYLKPEAPRSKAEDNPNEFTEDSLMVENSIDRFGLE